METLSTTSQGDSSVKSDDSSPRNEAGRSSPPPKCAICLGSCKNKSFTDSCLHQFCFKCILKWSKVKAECPLCKQIFKSIIHNVRSNHQYEEYMVEQRTQVEDIEIDSITNATQRFRYRTTLTLPSRDSWAIEQLLLNYRARRPLGTLGAGPRHRRPSNFRRTVYRHNLWARPLPDFTGRFRDCTPEFYRYNESQLHRLIPWLSRELHYLLNENIGHISYVMSQIMELLPRYNINSPEFRQAVQRYFGDRTEHFLHELNCFASTPYDMAGYDRNVQYTTDSRVSTIVNEVISSSDAESTVDSEINIDDFLHNWLGDAPPGPSRVPAPVYPQISIANPPNNDVIPIETISHSDTDDDSSEVMVVGYIKPPHARTPEVVDLLESDSDVVIEDDPQPTSTSSQNQSDRQVPLVKLTLKQHHGPAPVSSGSVAATTSAPAPSTAPAHSAPATASDSEDSTYTPPLPRRKRTRRSSDTSRSSSTDTSSVTSDNYSSSLQTSSPLTVSYYSDSTSSYSSREKRPKRKRTKRTKTSSGKAKKKSKRSKSSTKSKKTKTKATERQTSRKSHSGKGVKKSKTNIPKVPEQTQSPLDEPSTSGTQHRSRGDRKKRVDKKKKNSENKRLRSAITVVNNQRHLRSSTCSETSSQTNSYKSCNFDDVPQNAENTSLGHDKNNSSEMPRSEASDLASGTRSDKSI